MDTLLASFYYDAATLAIISLYILKLPMEMLTAKFPVTEHGAGNPIVQKGFPSWFAHDPRWLWTNRLRLLD